LTRTDLGKWRWQSVKTVMSARYVPGLSISLSSRNSSLLVLLERMTCDRLTPLLDRAVAAVRRSAAGCQRRGASEWRLRPTGRQHSGHVPNDLRAGCAIAVAQLAQGGLGRGRTARALQSRGQSRRARIPAISSTLKPSPQSDRARHFQVQSSSP
jgi:hypothetical protein